jgi:hypothetical protein
VSFAQSNLEEEGPQHPAVRRMFSSLAVLLLSGLLVLIFAIGAYLLIRVGRAVTQKPPAQAGPTQYADAWSQYRISDAEVDAAMRNWEDVPPDAEPPGPAKPEPPRTP